MSQTIINFIHDNHVTKNTFRFTEVDENGKILEIRDAKIGKLYFKKSTFNGTCPQVLTVTVEY